jgi:hypothetical protein
MMHNDPKLWLKSTKAVEFCKLHNIKYICKPFDQRGNKSLLKIRENKSLLKIRDSSYTNEQFNYFKTFWLINTNSVNLEQSRNRYEDIEKQERVSSICDGRACCGGRKLALNNDLKSNVTFVPKQGFKDWYCSVNWFFLYIRQVDGAIFVNKDCKMDFNGNVAPIGNLNSYQTILDNLKKQFENKSMPVIQCAKSICLCGYCAPKAEKLDDFKDLIKRNVITDVIKYE